MKLNFLIVVGLVFGMFGFTSCGPQVDKKKCEQLCEKIEDDDLKKADYAEMIEQCDALLSYFEAKTEEIEAEESKDKRCDEYEMLFDDSDEAEYVAKMANALEEAKDDDELKGELRDEYTDKGIKSRFKSLAKRVDRRMEKCRDDD